MGEGRDELAHTHHAPRALLSAPQPPSHSLVGVLICQCCVLQKKKKHRMRWAMPCAAGCVADDDACFLSAMTQKGLKPVFDEAIRAVLMPPARPAQKKPKGCSIV